MAGENGMCEARVGITPHLVVKGGAAAIDFYVAAFGAHEVYRMPGPDGRLMHAQLIMNGGPLMLADDFPEYGCGTAAPVAGGNSVVLHLEVPDADAAFARAVEAGATVAMPLSDTFWGQRYGQVIDPCGHRWSIAHTIEKLTPEQTKERAAAAFAIA